MEEGDDGMHILEGAGGLRGYLFLVPTPAHALYYALYLCVIP